MPAAQGRVVLPPAVVVGVQQAEVAFRLGSLEQVAVGLPVHVALPAQPKAEGIVMVLLHHFRLAVASTD